MKKLFLIIIFSSIQCICQNQDSTCRDISVKAINSSFKNEESFNAYTNNENLYIDIDYKIKANIDSYNKSQEKGNKILIESSKDSMFNIIKSMADGKLFDYEYLEECNFNKIFFNLTYITSDYYRITYSFFILQNELIKIKDRINKSDVFDKITFINKVVK